MDDPDGITLELGSAQTRSWRTASSGFAELWKADPSPAKPFEPNSRGTHGKIYELGSTQTRS